MSLREHFLAFDDMLAAKGVPPLTAWWRAGVGEWLDAYERGHLLELWACAGRGSAKSTALYKLALFFALFGDFTVPPGERHYAIVLSRLKDEASKAIAIISQWLRLLDEPHRPAGDVIELLDQPRGIRVVAASVAAASGWRAFFVGKDERSKWPSGGAAEDDASEIDTSASAMTATHALAPVVAFGSAWGASGTFYDAIISGSDGHRVVLGPAPTWIAAPHISEESTHRKERDPRRWAREYRCEFQAGALSAFSAQEVARLPRTLTSNAGAMGNAIMVLDSSAGRGDAWAWCAAQHVFDVVGDEYLHDDHVVTDHRGVASILRHPRFDNNGAWIPNPDYVARQCVYIDEIGALEGTFGATVPFPQAVARTVAIAQRHGITRVFGDQYQAYPLKAEFEKYGIEFESLAWTATTKVEACAMLRSMLADQTICAEPGEEAKRMSADLLELREEMTKGGAITVQAQRTRRGHGDRGMLAMLIARAESEGLIAGSPIERGGPVLVSNAYQ